jgi:hypothetical protein
MLLRLVLAGVLLGAPAASARAGTVRARAGAIAHVADAAVAAFQCVIDRLEAEGYSVRFMGGYRKHGSVPHSLHPKGLALDINQLARNVTRPKMPANEIAIANGCGAVSGAQWRHGDSGHFQIGGWAGRHGVKSHHHRHRKRYPHR